LSYVSFQAFRFKSGVSNLEGGNGENPTNLHPSVGHSGSHLSFKILQAFKQGTLSSFQKIPAEKQLS